MKQKAIGLSVLLLLSLTIVANMVFAPAPPVGFFSDDFGAASVPTFSSRWVWSTNSSSVLVNSPPSMLTLSAVAQNVSSNPVFFQGVLQMRANMSGVFAGAFIGFQDNTFSPKNCVGFISTSSTLYYATMKNGVGSCTTGISIGSVDTIFHNFTLAWSYVNVTSGNGEQVQFCIDGFCPVFWKTTTNIPTISMPINFFVFLASIRIDWVSYAPVNTATQFSTSLVTATTTSTTTTTGSTFAYSSTSSAKTTTTSTSTTSTTTTSSSTSTSVSATTTATTTTQSLISGTSTTSFTTSTSTTSTIPSSTTTTATFATSTTTTNMGTTTSTSTNVLTSSTTSTTVIANSDILGNGTVLISLLILLAIGLVVGVIIGKVALGGPRRPQQQGTLRGPYPVLPGTQVQPQLTPNQVAAFGELNKLKGSISQGEYDRMAREILSKP